MFRSPAIEVYRMKKLLIGTLIAALLLSGCQGLFPSVPASGETSQPAGSAPPEVTRQATVSPTAVPPTVPPSTTLPAATPPDPAVRSAVKLKDLIDRFNALDRSQWRGYWEEKCQYSKDSADETNAAMLEMTLEDYQILKAYVLPRIAEYEASQTSPPPTETDPPAPSTETTAPPTEPPATEPPTTAATEPPTAATDPPTEPPTDPAPNPGGGSFLDGYGMLGSINSARQAAGLSAYAWDSSLASIAQTRAMELAQLFSHDRPGGGRVTNQYYECIYYGTGYLGALDSAFSSWWNSPTHHDIIMQAEGESCYIAGYQIGDYTYWVLVRPYWN